MKKQKLQAKIVLQIHDELIIEAAEEEKEIVSKILKDSMESACKLSVNLDVDLQTGKTWFETK